MKFKTSLLIVFWSTVAAIILVFWKKELFFNKINTEQAIHSFSVSQYVLGDAYQEKVNDEIVYITAAVAQSNGTNPTEINFEHPPLGKYLIGFGIAVFNNPLWINILAYIITIASIGYILQHWGVPSYLVLIGMGLFSFSGSFVAQQFSNIMLDGFYVCFYMLFLTTFFTNTNNLKKQILLGFFSGLLFSTKYSIPLGFVLVGIPLIISFLKGELKITGFFLIILICSCIYFLSYTMYFISGKNLIDFIYFEWYRFRWWFGDRTMPSWLILSSLFKGYYPAWFSENQNEIVEMTGWTFLFPFQFLVATVGGMYLWLKEKSTDLLILLLIGVGVFISTGIGKSSDLKYLIIVMPTWSLIIVKLLNRLLKKQNV